MVVLINTIWTVFVCVFTHARRTLLFTAQVSWREFRAQDSDQMFAQLWAGPLSLQEDATRGVQQQHQQQHRHHLYQQQQLQQQGFITEQSAGAGAGAKSKGGGSEHGKGYVDVSRKEDYVDL